jgi:rfaE bifunctional protein kinase chain/domain
MANTDFDNLFHAIAQLKVGVIGDIMLDTYWWGSVDRISPEAPVPVVALSKKEQRIGGAGNVALNAVSLGAAVHMISVLGRDDDGEQVIGMLNRKNIDTSYLLQSEHRITTNKIRIISRNQHMMRLDAELADDLIADDENKLLYTFENYLAAENPHLIILEDYNKGVLTENVIKRIVSLCKKNQVLTAVDPKRKNFFAYEGIDIFKPNLKEVKDGLNIIREDVNINVLKDMHLLLQEKLKHAVSLITLSEKGVFYQRDDDADVVPTHIRSIADVSGAGDTVIAVAALVFAATGNPRLMAETANIAGGLVCEEVGTVAINKDELLKECKKLLTGAG